MRPPSPPKAAATRFSTSPTPRNDAPCHALFILYCIKYADWLECTRRWLTLGRNRRQRFGTEANKRRPAAVRVT
ncbi:hypothetical protein EMIT0158MI4_150066 [Burkholderia ambifaria]